MLMTESLSKANKTAESVTDIHPTVSTASSDYSQYNLAPAVSKPNPKGHTKNRKASLVYHENGKRWEFVDEVITTIAAGETLQFAFNEKGLAIGTKLPGCNADFLLSKNGNAWVVYSKSLALEAIKRFSLDFTGRSTISFQDVVYLNTDGAMAAFFLIVQDEQETDNHGDPTNPDANDEDEVGDRSASASTGNSDRENTTSFATDLTRDDNQEFDTRQQ